MNFGTKIEFVKSKGTDHLYAKKLGTILNFLYEIHRHHLYYPPHFNPLIFNPTLPQKKICIWVQI
jgi:hypothetical protein